MTKHSWHLSYLQPTKTEADYQQPYSIQFDDVYFNDEGGLNESRHVFIESNKLPQRWLKLTDDRIFCIAETGFGTGLNLLTTLQAWQAAKNKPKKLHFISCEKYPLTLKDMQMAHGCFPELSKHSQQLLNIWTQFNDSFRAGIHQFQWLDDVTLTLLLGDASENLSQLKAQVDAWFLDGFAPSKNPDMWHDDLFSEINRLSRTGTTLATFTAASKVRKSLEANGFKVKKTPGFGRKREMITATFDSANKNRSYEHNWNPLPKSTGTSQSKISRLNIRPAITILGAGIAGMCLAYHFKQADYQVTIIDQHGQALQGASGNDMAMVMPVLTAHHSPESALYQRAFEAALRFYHPAEFKQVGVAQHLHSAKHKKWAQTIQQFIDLPMDLLAIKSDSTALYSSAGYVETQALANRLQSFVDHWLQADVLKLNGTEAGQWQLLNERDEVINQTELLVVANGISAQKLLQPHDFGLIAKHGMTTSLEAPAASPLKHIQLADGYVIPNQNQKQWLCGATFDHLDPNKWYQAAELHDDHQQRNVSMWAGHRLHQQLQQARVTGGHAAIRATTTDHLPICGPVIEQEQFKSDYHDLHHGRHWQHYPPAKPLKNLYVMSGLGSRGFTSAPLLAQYLTAMILTEPLPLEADLCKIIHPNRFLYKSLKKMP